MSRWLRINEDCIHNPKILKLPEALRWQWVALLCVASQNDGALPPIDDVALCLRVTEAKAAEFITKLVKARLIDRDGEVFVPHNWKKRQFKTDGSDPTNAQRQKRYRDRQRNDSNGVTDNGSNDVMDKRPEQSRAETESEQSRADAGCAPVDEDLKRRAAAVGAGVSAHFLGRHLPVPNLSRCEHWLREGYAQGTIVGAVEAVLKRGTKPSTLDYFDGAIRDAHAKAPPAAGLQVVAQQTFVVEGTLEWNCWDQHLRATTGRGSPVTDNRDENGRLRRGWWRPTTVPEGYDEATGERIAPTNEEDAA